jgi:hypothetical protein
VRGIEKETIGLASLWCFWPLYDVSVSGEKKPYFGQMYVSLPAWADDAKPLIPRSFF